MSLLDKALLFAEKAHKDQLYGNLPYLNHLKSTASIAYDLGYDETIIVSCILHDILEDTNVTYTELKQQFGKEIAEIVYCVTDELGRNRYERKTKTYQKTRDNWKAVIVKICDRLANLRHSAEHSPNLLTMYLKEHDDFCSSLMSKEHPHTETNKAWRLLNTFVLDINILKD